MPADHDPTEASPPPATGMPAIPPDTRIVDVRDARALAAFGTPERCGVFEVLRCFRRPATLAELSAATRLPASRLAGMLDDLA
ncbi:MAG: hypothetical protein ACKPEA_10650, partial [Planctomycetota bacterium]